MVKEDSTFKKLVGQSGQIFDALKEWLGEYNSGQKNMDRLRKENREHQIEVVGAKLRNMMSWIKKK